MKVSILIPCHNEENSIKQCLSSCLNQSKKADQIVVVNDGSTDNSINILKKFQNNITLVNIPKATGNKSFAQQEGLKKIKGDILITTDGDTILDRDFVKNIVTEFENPKTMACAGYVKSLPFNYLTACREIEYIMGQEIHKFAQSKINTIFVIPGCAAAFRTKVLKKIISFDHDTLTEDLDFTYKCHEKGLKIAYSKKAIVYTQDPTTLTDYIKQLRRWNAGNWQNLLKHLQIIHKPANALELSLIYGEGLVFPIILVLAIIFNIKAFILFYFTYVSIISVFAIYGALRDQRLDILLVIPIHLFVSFINYTVYFEQFFQEVILRKKNLIWFQPERKAWV